MEQHNVYSFRGDYEPPYWDTNLSHQWPDSQANYYETEPNYHGGNPYAQFNNFANFGESVNRSQDDYSNMHNSEWSDQPTNSWSRPIEMRTHPPCDYMYEGPSMELDYQQDYSDMPHSGWSNHQNHTMEAQTQRASRELEMVEAKHQRFLENFEATSRQIDAQIRQMMSRRSENPEEFVIEPVNCDHPEIKELEDTLQSSDEVLTVNKDVVDEAQVVVDGGDITKEGIQLHDVQETHTDIVEAVTLERSFQKNDDEAHNEDASIHFEEAQRSNNLVEYITTSVLPSSSPQRVLIHKPDKQFSNLLDTSLELPTYFLFVDFLDPSSNSIRYLEETPKRKRKLDSFGVAEFDPTRLTVKKHKLSPKLLEFHPP